MGILTDRQQADLDKAILAYIEGRSLKQTAAAFREEVNFDGSSDPKLESLLEKKWVAVIRLQKRILELETRNAALEEAARSDPIGRSAASVDWLPKHGGNFALTGHRASVSRITFHPLQPLLASASEDYSIRIWDWEAGELQRTLSGHTRDVKDVDFHPRGDYLVSGASDLTVRIWSTDAWDTPGYNGEAMYGHDHTISSVRFTPSGEHIISASRDETIKIWEVLTKFCVRTISGHEGWIRGVAPSSDGRLLASCSSDHLARLFDFTSGQMKMELRGHENAVQVIEFVPSNTHTYIQQWLGTTGETGPDSYIVTGSRDKQIILWDTVSGQPLKKLAHDGWVYGIAFHPSGKYLLSISDDKQLRVWDLSTGRCTRTVEASNHVPYCLAWTKMTVTPRNASKNQQPQQANVLATGGVDRTVKIWMP